MLFVDFYLFVRVLEYHAPPAIQSTMPTAPCWTMVSGLHHVGPWWAALMLMRQCHCQCQWRNWEPANLDMCISVIQYNLQPWWPEAYLISVSRFLFFVQIPCITIFITDRILEQRSVILAVMRLTGYSSNRCHYRDVDDFPVKAVYVMVRWFWVQNFQ